MSSPEPVGQFQPDLAQSFHGWRVYKLVNNEGQHIFPRGDNNEITKIWKSSFIEPLGQFQANLEKSIPRWRGFQFVQMERPHIFTMEDNNKFTKRHLQN